MAGKGLGGFGFALIAIQLFQAGKKKLQAKSEAAKAGMWGDYYSSADQRQIAADTAAAELAESQTKQAIAEANLRLKVAEAEKKQADLLGAIDANNASRVFVIVGAASAVGLLLLSLSGGKKK